MTMTKYFINRALCVSSCVWMCILKDTTLCNFHNTYLGGLNPMRSNTLRAIRLWRFHFSIAMATIYPPIASMMLSCIKITHDNFSDPPLI